jgi:hypothetical protein
LNRIISYNFQTRKREVISELIGKHGWPCICKKINFFILNLYLYFLNYFDMLLKINYKNKKTLKINRFPLFLSKHAI